MQFNGQIEGLGQKITAAKTAIDEAPDTETKNSLIPAYNELIGQYQGLAEQQSQAVSSLT